MSSWRNVLNGKSKLQADCSIIALSPRTRSALWRTPNGRHGRSLVGLSDRSTPFQVLPRTSSMSSRTSNLRVPRVDVTSHRPHLPSSAPCSPSYTWPQCTTYNVQCTTCNVIQRRRAQRPGTISFRTPVDRRSVGLRPASGAQASGIWFVSMLDVRPTAGSY